MVFRELFQRVGVHAIDPRVTHMQHVNVAALEDQRAEGADIATVLVEACVAAHGLRVEPGVGGTQVVK